MHSSNWRSSPLNRSLHNRRSNFHWEINRHEIVFSKLKTVYLTIQFLWLFIWSREHQVFTFNCSDMCIWSISKKLNKTSFHLRTDRPKVGCSSHESGGDHLELSQGKGTVSSSAVRICWRKLKLRSRTTHTSSPHFPFTFICVSARKGLDPFLRASNAFLACAQRMRPASQFFSGFQMQSKRNCFPRHTAESFSIYVW